MEKVTVAIASIGRKTLVDTLNSLSALPEQVDVDLSVVVADDSQDGSAETRISECDAVNLTISCVKTASGNISTARNALLDACKGDWLIFVDDDEWVDRDWLEKLFSCQKDFNADVVIGPVRPVYPEDTPQWLKKANPLYHDWGSRGQRLDTGRGGNTLVRMQFVREYELRFREAFGVTGGEDTAFFSEAAEKGARIYATDDANAYEAVPKERLTSEYILSRATRSGQSYANMRLEASLGISARVWFGVDALAKCVVAGGLAVLMRLFDRARSFKMQQKFALNLGKLRAITGQPLAQIYKRPDYM